MVCPITQGDHNQREIIFHRAAIMSILCQYIEIKIIGVNPLYTVRVTRPWAITTTQVTEQQIVNDHINMSSSQNNIHCTRYTRPQLRRYSSTCLAIHGQFFLKLRENSWLLVRCDRALRIARDRYQHVTFAWSLSSRSAMVASCVPVISE